MNSDTTLPAIGRRPRRATLSTEPPKRYPKDLSTGVQLEFSKEKMLLLDRFSPDYYTVRLAQAHELPLTLTISTENANVVISPSEIEFLNEGQEAEVMVFTQEEVKETGVVRLQHSARGSSEKAVLTAFYVDKTAFKLYCCGLDDHSHLGTERSLKKFLAAAFPGDDPVRSEISEPIPEVIYGNDELLFHESHEDKSYCPVDPPSWVALAAGDSHVLSVTNEGHVYTWGLGSYGQLGITNAKSQELTRSLAIKNGIIKSKVNSTSPYASYQSKTELLENCAPAPVRIVELVGVWQVACGAQHSLVLTRECNVYVFGRGDSGQLGLGSKDSLLTPTSLPRFTSNSVIKITAGYSTSFFIDSEGGLYSCGAHSSGALGHPADMLTPTKVPNLEPVHCCSSSEAHTGVVTFEGVVVMFGNPAEGRLGGQESWIKHNPASFDGRRIRAVCCGGLHTHVLTEDLEMYSFGGNRKGQLGLTRSDFQ